ncbi:hypothetical protein [Vibrio cyclitrophicus]|uniref:hypothetical protein n=1 Tax=Vibrio cyclitrophicus TaxID=47951 RepID=UPI0003111687|nr:hypothetical protein [Vibrio cyclitrophicus]OCH37792.1 hypothetical protein A6E07_14485 [Vibrio cyclitrophicus]OEE84774.1 hypothetical protein OAI_20050 [Vibrio cyclitrophicus FF160]OEF30442.1 hypothetical protein OA9_20720 [Vibrio cyclitrophicus 1F97]OEF40973.1 hypothetical protein OAC_11195 [Vibrio cyclitrophicus 1F273]OEF76467.1 hypothetical protein OA5_20210 [Vibrio cyclitrophicus 1F111]
MKKLVLSAMLVAAPVAAAEISVLEDLKSTPLTSYEAGRNQLATFTAAINLFTKLEGKQKFTFNLLEDESTLGLEISGFQPVKKVTKDECNSLFIKLGALNVVPDLPTLIWPDLSKEQAKDIQSELFIQAKIIAKENHEFSITCKKSLAEI